MQGWRAVILIKKKAGSQMILWVCNEEEDRRQRSRLADQDNESWLWKKDAFKSSSAGFTRDTRLLYMCPIFIFLEGVITF